MVVTDDLDWQPWVVTQLSCGEHICSGRLIPLSSTLSVAITVQQMCDLTYARSKLTSDHCQRTITSSGICRRLPIAVGRVCRRPRNAVNSFIESLVKLLREFLRIEWKYVFAPAHFPKPGTAELSPSSLYIRADHLNSVGVPRIHTVRS
jgi:hypothetical protein